MDTVLIERWLGGGPRTLVHDLASVTLVRDAVRAIGRQLGLSEVAVGTAATIATELATNQLAHARHGAVAVRAIERGGVPGVEVVAADGGDGILHAGDALDGAPRAVGSLGIGLSGVQRLADEVDFDVRLGIGTCVRARTFAGPVARWREVAILGRNCGGERTSGDDAAFERRGGALLLALVDGLGHGPEAREPARLAIGVLASLPSASPAGLLREADAALRGTRGAVMGVVLLDDAAGELTHAAYGNITTSVRGEREKRSYAGPGGVLGAASARRGPFVDEVGALRARDVVAMYSDGLTTRFDLDAAQAVLGRHPLVIAQLLLDRFGRSNDDATVLVAR